MRRNSEKTPEELLQGAKVRFWERVRKSDGCWMFEGNRSGGYGYIRYIDRYWQVHRFSWLIHFGEIPDNLGVLHTCDTPGCVRPDHLFLGTALDNARDRKSKNRSGTTPLTEDQIKEIQTLHRLPGNGNRGNTKELALRFSVPAYTILRFAKLGRDQENS